MSPVSPTSLKGRIAQLRAHIREPLYQNAYALMLNTAVTSGLGAVGTFVTARLYKDSKQVGVAIALIAAMQMLSALTQLNFASVLARYTPRAGKYAGSLLRSAYFLAGGCAVVATAAVVAIAALVTPDTNSLHLPFAFAVFFVASTAAYSVFNLQDAALTGLRRTIWVPIENGVFGIAKIVLLLIFAAAGMGAYGIYAAWAIPILILIIPVNSLIFRHFLPRHTAESDPETQPIDRRQVARFIAGDYLGSLFAQATTTLLPLLVISALDERATAHFGIAQTVGIALDLIVLNLASSFTVEGAHDESKIGFYARKMIVHMAKIVLPLVVVVLIAAPYLMGIFGAEYRENSTDLLRLLAIATVPRIFTSIYGALARLEHKTYKIARTVAIQATILVGGSYILMPHLGVNGVGVAGLISQLFCTGLVMPSLLKALRKPTPSAGMVQS